MRTDLSFGFALRGISVERGPLARLFFGQAASTLLVDDTGLICADSHAELVLVRSMTGPARVLEGWMWSRLEVETSGGPQVLRGFGKAGLPAVVDALNDLLKSHVGRRLAAEYVSVSAAAAAIDNLLSLREYARASRITPVLAAAVEVSATNTGVLWDLYSTEEQRQAASRISHFVQDWKTLSVDANARFVEGQKAEYSRLFETIEGSPLTQAQRTACVVDEDNNLVLAGAGTGKTSTMMGRAGYLIASGKAQPWQILMLAFARKAADEMQDRQDERLKEYAKDGTPAIKTFHALGLEIIGSVEGKRPALSVLAEDSFALARFINDQLTLQCVDPGYVADVVSWCFIGRFPYGNPFDFESENEYLEYVRTNELRTLKGERVKSFEEVLVANFLYSHNVEYRYEEKYRIPDDYLREHFESLQGRDSGFVSDSEHRVYMPDFYLPDYDIYIEHFALNSQLKPPTGWKDYAQGVAWKRNLHAKYGTRMIETRSHMQHDGVLELCLGAVLQAAGVELDERPVSELLDELRAKGALKYVTDPIASFLGLLKQSDLGLPAARELGTKSEDADRFELFFMLFEPIFQAYQAHLVDKAEIDFADMIKIATSHVESGRFTSHYQHILVDEFQDISALRARLIRGLVALNPGSVLFAVGDDWQSIYRFTGSDIGLTRDFQDSFGPTAITALDTTFRFNNRIGTVASEFVLKNPNQIKKQIESLRVEEAPAVSLLPTSDPAVGVELTLGAITERLGKDDATRASVLVLGRYGYVTEQWRTPDERRRLAKQYPDLDVDFMTVHGAKGREADYVVILGVEMGRNGFPAEKPSDSIMELLLPLPEAYSFAEERRLFYVAMTRARHRVFLVYEPTIASAFIQELATVDAEGTLLYDVCLDEFRDAPGAGAQSPLVECPQCHMGFLARKNGQYGAFVACTRFPYCRYTEPPCPQCGSVMTREGGMRVCAAEGCDEKSPICPKCGGAMVRRSSAFGPFWGCLNYKPNAENTCTHTINIGSPRRAGRSRW